VGRKCAGSPENARVNTFVNFNLLISEHYPTSALSAVPNSHIGCVKRLQSELHRSYRNRRWRAVLMSAGRRFLPSHTAVSPPFRRRTQLRAL
jgi:hypothetical protein